MNFTANTIEFLIKHERYQFNCSAVTTTPGQDPTFSAVRAPLNARLPVHGHKKNKDHKF